MENPLVGLDLSNIDHSTKEELIQTYVTSVVSNGIILMTSLGLITHIKGVAEDPYTNIRYEVSLKIISTP
jgi:hypothetical protein